MAVARDMAPFFCLHVTDAPQRRSACPTLQPPQAPLTRHLARAPWRKLFSLSDQLLTATCGERVRRPRIQCRHATYLRVNSPKRWTVEMLSVDDTSTRTVPQPAAAGRIQSRYRRHAIVPGSEQLPRRIA